MACFFSSKRALALLTISALLGGCGGGTESPTSSGLASADGTTVATNAKIAPGKSTDLYGSGSSNIVWRNTDGSGAVWQVNTSGITGSNSLGNVDSTWNLFDAAGDFDGDSKSDLVWRNTNGAVSVWLMNGPSPTSTAQISAGVLPADWTLVSARGDYDGDGKSDLLWRSTASAGTVVIWFMNGAAIRSTATIGDVSSDWKLVDGDGNYNADNKSDLLWRNANGTVAIWSMNGATVQASVSLGSVGNEWSVASGAGDFNGDGTSDILWRNSANDIAVWLLSANALQSTGGLGNVGSEWSVQDARGDYNLDGKSDILWRNSSGQVAVWGLNGTSLAYTLGLPDPGASWSIVSRGNSAAQSLAPLPATSEQARLSSTKIVSGYQHVCGILASGSVSCWGGGTLGQLGLGSGQTFIDEPTQVPSVSNVIALSAGKFSTCAITADHTVTCWGNSVGNGTGAASTFTPTVISSLTNVTALAMSTGDAGSPKKSDASCAVKSDGTVWCWGDNDPYFPLGAAGNSNLTVATQIVGLSDVVSIALGTGAPYNFGCALLSDGTVKCWGDNSYGSLGNGSTTSTSTPTLVPGLSNIVAIRASVGGTVCAIKADTTVACWGNSLNGVLGPDGNSQQAVNPNPLAIPNLAGVVDVEIGEQSVCALKSDRTLGCWGHNTTGVLGNGTYTDSTAPQSVLNLTRVDALTVSNGVACALQNDGQAYCWGSDFFELGNGGSPTKTNTPVATSGGAQFWRP